MEAYVCCRLALWYPMLPLQHAQVSSIWLHWTVAWFSPSEWYGKSGAYWLRSCY